MFQLSLGPCWIQFCIFAIIKPNKSIRISNDHFEYIPNKEPVLTSTLKAP